ncbi:ATP-binding protein [Candidatus Parcubacteria bacterium]|nr:ATP-binding protein [Candidatus Parcubacteria bacterium]
MKLKQRKIISKIKLFLDKKTIIVLHGSRQVGKTSIMHLIKDYLIKEKKIKKDNIFYFDLEDFVFLDLCNGGVKKTIQYLEESGAQTKDRIYLFIDEIQYLDNPSSFLKLFHDHWGDKIKLVVSGSSSFDIKNKFKDSLVGRTVDFEIFSLDFEEFLLFKNKKINVNSFSEIIIAELRDLYEEYIFYGGYPAIVLENNIEIKSHLLKQIINTYVKKDIRDLANIREINKFNQLIKVLASQSGGLLNISELSNTLKLTQKTVEEYLFILENTYIIRRVYPFYKNIRSELTKMPKIYFEDNGLMNLLANKKFLERVDGQLFENSVYCELRKNLDIESINFWRTNTGQEVDFIITEEGVVPLEVKLKFSNKKLSGLKYFADKYKIKESFVCSLTKTEESNKKNIKQIYPWRISFKKLK